MVMRIYNFLNLPRVQRKHLVQWALTSSLQYSYRQKRINLLDRCHNVSHHYAYDVTHACIGEVVQPPAACRACLDYIDVFCGPFQPL